VESATYEQDVRDFCDDCGVRVKSVQNIFRDWHRSLKVGAALGAANVAGQVNLLVRAGVAGGEDAAATEARVKAALEASEKHEEDLSQRKYSLMLHMQQWQSTVAVGTDTDQPNTMLTKVYKAHVSMGGKTLKGSIIGGEFKFRQYMMEVKREAAARGEMAFKTGADAFMAPLDDDCFGNWALFAAYAERWIQRYACDGLKVPFDERLLESVKKEVAAKSFVSTNTSVMRDVEPKQADPSANAVATLELLARMLPGGGQPPPQGATGHPAPQQTAGHSWGGGPPQGWPQQDQWQMQGHQLQPPPQTQWGGVHPSSWNGPPPQWGGSWQGAGKGGPQSGWGGPGGGAPGGPNGGQVPSTADPPPGFVTVPEERWEQLRAAEEQPALDRVEMRRRVQAQMDARDAEAAAAAAKAAKALAEAETEALVEAERRAAAAAQAEAAQAARQAADAEEARRRDKVKLEGKVVAALWQAERKAQQLQREQQQFDRRFKQALMRRLREEMPRMLGEAEAVYEERLERSAQLKAKMAKRARAAEKRAVTSDRRLERAQAAEQAVRALNAEIEELQEHIAALEIELKVRPPCAEGAFSNSVRDEKGPSGAGRPARITFHFQHAAWRVRAEGTYRLFVETRLLVGRPRAQQRTCATRRAVRTPRTTL
jgi:hypothetical protein